MTIFVRYVSYFWGVSAFWKVYPFIPWHPLVVIWAMKEPPAATGCRATWWLQSGLEVVPTLGEICSYSKLFFSLMIVLTDFGGCITLYQPLPMTWQPCTFPFAAGRCSCPDFQVSKKTWESRSTRKSFLEEEQQRRQFHMQQEMQWCM